MHGSEGRKWLMVARGNQQRGCKLIGLLLSNMALIGWKEGSLKLFLRGKSSCIRGILRFLICLHAKWNLWASWGSP